MGVTYCDSDSYTIIIIIIIVGSFQGVAFSWITQLIHYLWKLNLWKNHAHTSMLTTCLQKLNLLNFAKQLSILNSTKKLQYPGVLIIDFQEFIYGWDYEYL